MSQSKTVIEHIASIMLARQNCLERMQEPLGGNAQRWYNLHTGALTDLLKDQLPSGSGFDSGVDLNSDLTDVKAERFVFDCPFHCMNENGFYTDWTEFRVTVTPSFVGKMNIEIERTGGLVDDEEHLADYICEAMYDSLCHEMTIPSHYYADV
jgi:hypothetical protein